MGRERGKERRREVDRGAEGREAVDMAMDTSLPISTVQKVKFQILPCTFLIFFLKRKHKTIG